MNNFPRYDSYKDSGVDWLGKIPAHWQAVSLGSLMELKSDKNHPDYEVLSVYREYGVIPKDSRDDNHNATSLDTTTYKAVDVGDLVVNKMKAWQGSMGISSYKGIVSPAYITCKITSKKVFSNYLHQLLRSNSYIGEYNRISYGVRIGQWDMHYEDFKKVIVLLPPISEQKTIAEFIYNKTAQIEIAIAQKESQIELLRERREIIINKAVTRGLNLNIKMKHSGVDWIGEIPEHWKIQKFKHHFVSAMGETILASDLVEEGDYPVFSATEGGHYFGFINNPKVKLNIGDLVIPARGNSIGFPKLVYEKATCSQTTIYAKRITQINSKFVFYYLLGCKPYLFFFTQTAIPQITVNEVKNNLQLVPPPEEQAIIAEYLDNVSAKIETAISCKQKEIERLKEYKTVLINSAVTGKIKVCGNSQNTEIKTNYA